MGPDRGSGSVRSVHSVFYEADGPDTFAATDVDDRAVEPDAQHGGPPSALAARVMEAHEPAETSGWPAWPSTSCGRFRSAS